MKWDRSDESGKPSRPRDLVSASRASWSAPDSSWQSDEFHRELSDSGNTEPLIAEAKHVPRGSGVYQDPQVCGGDTCITGTRIPIWTLEHARRLGLSDEEILADYPSLSQDDLDCAWEYVESHQDEIDRQIAENQDV